MNDDQLRAELAEDLVLELKTHVTELETHRDSITPQKAPDPEARQRALRDLDIERSRSTRLAAAVERIVQQRRDLGPQPDLAMPKPPAAGRRAPLPWRVARVLARQASAAIRDLGWSLGRAKARRQMPASAGSHEPPHLSVIIPTRNRGPRLIATLDAYQVQTSDLSFEVVVVDDGSTDGSDFLLSERSQMDRYELKVLRQASSGPAAARNKGLEAARAELVLFTGDDIEPTPDLLLRHWQFHRAANFDPKLCALGLTHWPSETALTATMRHIDGPGAQQFNYGWLKAGRTYDFRHFYTSNISLHKSTAMDAGGFDTSFPDAAFEDAELAYRLSLRGQRIVFLEDALAFHHHPYTAQDFARRQQRCGRMGRVLTHLHPELSQWTGLHGLRRRRAEILCLGEDRLRDLVELSRRLPELRSHAMAVAAALDGSDPSGTDAFLMGLFHFSVLEGLSDNSRHRQLWLASWLVSALREPSRRLRSELDGSPRKAAETLADLPELFSPMDKSHTHPVSDP